MNNCFIVDGQVKDWRVQLEICSIVSELLKIETAEDLTQLLYSPEHNYELLSKNGKRLRKVLSDMSQYSTVELNYDYTRDCVRDYVLCGFRIIYFTHEDDARVNKELEEAGENMVVENFIPRELCRVFIPELAARRIPY